MGVNKKTNTPFCLLRAFKAERCNVNSNWLVVACPPRGRYNFLFGCFIVYLFFSFTKITRHLCNGRCLQVGHEGIQGVVFLPASLSARPSPSRAHRLQEGKRKAQGTIITTVRQATKGHRTQPKTQRNNHFMYQRSIVMPMYLYSTLLVVLIRRTVGQKG